MRKIAEVGGGGRLPEFLRPLFWDCDFDGLDWARHRWFIIWRVLTEGSWESIKWLRGRVGDDELRMLILRREGRGMTRQQLRFWELILNLPSERIDAWLAREPRKIWDGRRG
jgi:hypothetical protein